MSDETYVFEVNEQVRIKPFKRRPATRAKGGIRYGIVVIRTRHPGMCLIDLERQSKDGEEVYCVGSWATRGASGASWISLEHLEKMKRKRA